MMKLYYSPGAGSLAVHIALREADRSFELERVDLKTHITSAGRDYTKINPKRTVPTLILDPGGTTLSETAACLQYIADLAPDRHLAPPAGTFARYHLQEWLSFISTELDKQFAPLFEPDTPPATQERIRGFIGERYLYLGDVLYDRGYLMGESFSVADAYLFTILRWSERFGFDLQIYPNLDDYFLRMLTRPAVQGALAAEGLVEYKRYRRSA